ncbi:MAG: hypothetical protein PHW96_02685 [Candidatus Nanoarchaeia archaeon]|nr:hypothetical protein [Candidatus Nanoarchaeia archaeon]
MYKIKRAYKYAVFGLIFLSVGAIGLISAYSPEITGFSISVPAVGIASMSSLTMGLASLLIATNRFRKHVSESDYAVAYYLSIARGRNELYNVIHKLPTKKAVNGVVNVLVKAAIDRDKKKMYMICDIEDIIKDKIQLEKNPIELTASFELLGNALEMCEKYSKVPSEVVMSLKTLYALAKHSALKLYSK